MRLKNSSWIAFHLMKHVLCPLSPVDRKNWRIKPYEKIVFTKLNCKKIFNFCLLSGSAGFGLMSGFIGLFDTGRYCTLQLSLTHTELRLD
jgi:hypothetical protein